MRLGALLSPVAPPACWGCGSHARAGEPVCLPCRARLRWLGPQPVELAGIETWAPVAYEGTAKELVRALKYRGARGVAGAMSAQMAAGAPSDLLDACVLIPVPLPPERLRRRGFNQAAVLAGELAARTGLTVSPCLRRRGAASPQVGRGRRDRLVAIGDMSLRAPAPPRALLVDDVATTGATLSACARALHAGGTRQVRALTYARTLGR